MALTLKQARSVYNRIGRFQDWQAFTRTRPPTASSTLQIWLQTRRFLNSDAEQAGWLRVSGELPESVHYLGVDLSPVMINLAANRLSPWVERAEVVLVDGSLPLPANDGFADCVLSTFVFDLLDADYARAVWTICGGF